LSNTVVHRPLAQSAKMSTAQSPPMSICRAWTDLLWNTTNRTTVAW